MASTASETPALYSKLAALISPMRSVPRRMKFTTSVMVLDLRVSTSQARIFCTRKMSLFIFFRPKLGR